MTKKKLQYLSLLLFLTYLLNICVPCIPVRAEAISTPVSSFSDIAGHWAENGIKAWTARELAGGYPDGTFRPDSPITRAEFLTLLNRAFGYTIAGQVIYRDVAETDWFVGEIAKAAAVGYLGGYPDGTVKPQNPITRQEAAALFAKILPIDIDSDKNNKDDDKFTDQAQIPEWSQVAITAAVNGGYMSGYPDGTFQPARPITRAEAISVLDRVVGTLYNHAGTYGSSQGTTLLEGNVTINTAGITLQNTTITGNLYLTEGIGEGDVTLNNVTVQGTTKISGGGSNSIHLLNTTVGAVLVNVPSRNLVRLLAQGSTAVGTLEARTPARLEEEGLTGSGFTKVIINTQQAILSQGSTSPQEGMGIEENTGTENNTPVQETEPGIIVELLGQFNEVEVQSAAAQLDLQKGSIANLNLASTAQAAQINLATQTSINTLTADTPATVQGQGAIERIEANVDGVVVEASIISAEIKKKKSRDAALSDLIIDGTTVTGFAPDTLFYEVVVSHGTLETNVPFVKATAHHAKARVTVTQARGLTAPNNTATVLVTAENGSTQTYKVNFVKATVSGIAVKTAPMKTTYIEDDPLDLTGLVITLTRTDKSIEEIAFAEFEDKGISAIPAHGTTLSPVDNKVTITHTASGKSVEQGITVIPTYTVTVAAVSGGTADIAVDKPKAKAGDTVTVSITNLESGKKFEEITITSASGDVLTTEVMAGVEYTFTMPAEAVTVTVELEAIIYTVTFDKNSGNTEADPQTMTVTYGNTVGDLPTPPTKEGYAFAGWNTKTDSTGDDFTAETAVTGDITVYAQWVIKVIGVGLDKTDMILQIGTTATEPLIATVEPANATNKKVTWSSSDETIVTVDTDGVVTAVAIGEAIITVTTEDGGKTADCEVTVVDNTPIIDESCVLYLDGRYGGNNPATQTWYDLSGKGNDGTLTNFTYDVGSGWTGQGLQFDGVDDYVVKDVPDSFLADGKHTVEIWCNSADLGAYRGFIEIADKNFRNNNVRLGRIMSFNGTQIRYHSIYTNLNANQYVEVAIPTNSIVHLVGTFDGSKTILYVNGIKAGEVAGTIMYKFTEGQKAVYMGRDMADYRFFKGEIYGARIYNRALSPQEIAQNYLTTKCPEPLFPVDGAVLDLRGTEGTNDLPTTVWQDASGHGNHATLQNVAFTVGDGWTGDALEFDGVDSYAEIADKSNQRGMSELTLECWYRPYSWEPKYYGLISKWKYPNLQHYLLGYVNDKDSGNLNFWVSDGVGHDNFGVPLPELNKITHIMATFVGGKSLKIYYNGILQGSQSTTVERIYNITKEPLYVGRYATYSCHGEIYGARIYPKALTDAEVLQNYLAGKNSP